MSLFTWEATEHGRATIYFFVLNRTFRIALEKVLTREATSSEKNKCLTLKQIIYSDKLSRYFLPQLAAQKRKGRFCTASCVCRNHLWKLTVKSLRIVSYRFTCEHLAATFPCLKRVPLPCEQGLNVILDKMFNPLLLTQIYIYIIFIWLNTNYRTHL